ncbi:Talin-1 [Thelohanellus kitauei]|uniref:Talin-1 n=1 Tax=Thelohanellus kitauei TaxID=669202 RepID=A0A0C2MZ35_THEKT|nr:Talin-1 [Thelohanellus kitauei]
MEKLKQKLHTDDEIRWIEHDKTLSEQGIDASFILSLRRKYFYESTKNVLDPFELHILYKQVRGWLTSWCVLHFKLASLSLQIQKGNYEEKTFKLTEYAAKLRSVAAYLPKEFHSNAKALKKLIKTEYINLTDVKDFDCKQQYTSLCQNSKMYGVSIFLVKEKLKGKQRLGTILLGITKESVMRLDETTKNDFGDYDDDYSVLTTEADQIASILSGYIDLIIKKKKAQAEGLSSTAVGLVEEDIMPSQAVFIGTPGQAGTAKAQAVGARSQVSERVGGVRAGHKIGGMAAATRLYGRGKVQRSKQPQYQKFYTPTAAFLYKLDQLKEDIRKDDEELVPKDIENRNIGTASSPESYLLLKKCLAAGAIDSLALALSNVMVDVQDPDKIDYNLLSNHTAEADDSYNRIVEVLSDYASYCSEKDRLSLEDILKALGKHLKDTFDAFEITDDDVLGINKQELENGFNSTSNDLRKLIQLLGIDEVPKELFTQMMELGKDLGPLSTKFVGECQKVCEECQDEDVKNKIDQNTDNFKKQMSSLLAALQIMAKTFNDFQNVEQFVNMCDDLDHKIGVLVHSCEENASYKDFEPLKSSANRLQHAIGNMRLLVDSAHTYFEPHDELKKIIFDIMEDVDRTATTDTDLGELKAQSKNLALNLGKLLNTLKEKISNESDEKAKHELFMVAKSFADQTKLLMDNAKYIHEDGCDIKKGKETFNGIAENIRKLLSDSYPEEFNSLSALAIKKHVEDAIHATITMDSAMKRAMESCRSEALENGLLDNSEEMMRTLQDLVDSLKNFIDNPDSIYPKEDLMNRIEEHCANARKAINASTDAVPLVADFDHSSSLNKAIRGFIPQIETLEHLLSHHAEVSDEIKTHLAMQRIAAVMKQLEKVTTEVVNGSMPRFSPQDKELYDKELLNSFREIIKMQSQLTDPIYNEDPSNVANSLAKLSMMYHKLLNPLFGSAACSMHDPILKNECLATMKNVENGMNSTKICCLEAEKMYENEDKTLPDNLLGALKINFDAMMKLFENLPTNQDIEKSLKSMDGVIKKHESKLPGLPLKRGITFADHQKQISHDISETLEHVAELLRCALKDDLQQFPKTFSTFVESYATLYNDVKSLVDHPVDKNVGKIVEDSLNNVVKSGDKLSKTVKLFTSDPNTASKMFFSDAAKGFSDELSNMLLKILSSKPGRQECEHYKNYVKLVLRPMLERSNQEVIPGKLYSSCIDDIQKCRDVEIKNAVNQLTECLSSANSMANISTKVNDLGELIEQVVKNATQCSYILGMTDRASQSGSSYIFKENELMRTINEIKNEFETLEKPNAKLSPSDLEEFNKELVKQSANLVACLKNAVAELNGHPAIQKEVMEIANALSGKVKDGAIFLKDYEKCKNDREVKSLVNRTKDGIMGPLHRLIKLMETDEVSSIPGIIGDRGRLEQEPIITGCLNLVDEVSSTFDEIGKLIDEFNQPTKDAIIKKLTLGQKLTDDLVETLKSNAPGEALLSEIVDRLAENMSEIKKRKEDMASNLPNPGSSKEYENRLAQVISKMIDELNSISNLPAQSHLRAGKLECSVDLIETLPDDIQGLCLSLSNAEMADKNKLFDSLAKLNHELVHTVNSCRIKPQKVDSEPPKKFEVALSATLTSAKDLGDELKDLAQKESVIQGFINELDKINSSLNVAGNPKITSNIPQKDLDKQVNETLKNMLKLSQEIPSKAAEKSEMLNSKCQDLLRQHEKCVTVLFDNSYLKKDEKLKKSIRNEYKDMSESIKKLLEKVKAIEADVTDTTKRNEAHQEAKKISSNVFSILKLIQSSHKGAEACSHLCDIVEDKLHELDTCLLFAENKALDKEPDSKPFLVLGGELKGLVKDIATVLNNLENYASITDSDLLEVSQKLTKKTQPFLDLSKDAATSLGSGENDNQLSLLECTQKFGSSMTDLLGSLNESMQEDSSFYQNSTKPKISVAKDALKDYEKSLNNIEQKVSSTSEVLSSTVSKIEKMMKNLDPNTPCQWDNEKCDIKPEDAVRISKDIPLSCAKIVQALNSSKTRDIDDAIKKGDDSFEKLIKGVRKFLLASNEEIVRSVANSLKTASASYLDLLKYIQNHPTSPDMKEVATLSKVATENIFDFVKKCSDLKSEQFASMNDPQLLAERELLNAAASIELAAKKLAELKPKLPPVDVPNRELDFTGQILQAVDSIMKATSLLVVSASNSQKELVKSGRLKETSSSDTGQWSQGLISAARMVAESTHMLCDEAKNVVEGQGSEERMIGACNSIFGSTSQLIMACKVKADADSENQARLERAGGAVKKASKALIDSLKGSGYFATQKKEIKVDETQVGGMKQMLDALEEVARREKELTEAREKLIKLRQAKPRKENE